MNEATKYILFLITGIIIGLLLFNSCEQKEPIKPNVLKADSVVKIVYVYKHKADSLNTVKTKILVKYKTIRDTVVLHYKDDTIIMNYVNYCDSLNNINDSIIVVKNNIIKQQDTLVSIKDAIIHDNILELNTAKKQVNKAKRKAVITAVVSGVIVGGVLWFKRQFFSS